MGKCYRAVKRLIDIAASVFFLVVFVPIGLIIGLSIFISAGNPVIFSSKRVGMNKKKFTVYKFRTLANGVERRDDGLSDKVVINGFTNFMRLTHLDETLQLYNVIKGEMTLIGPRPLDVPRYNWLKGQDAKWDSIFEVRPGMTCLNQIARYTYWGMGKLRELDGLDKIKRRNRLVLDRYYIKNESFMLDAKITYWTLSYLFLGFFKKMLKKAQIV